MTDVGNSRTIWIYDLRANMPSFGKRTPLTHEQFTDFTTCYGKNSDGSSKRTDHGDGGRFRCFTREQITDRGENLDINWLKDESAAAKTNEPGEPSEIVDLIRDRLQIALDEIEALTALLEGEDVET